MNLNTNLFFKVRIFLAIFAFSTNPMMLLPNANAQSMLNLADSATPVMRTSHYSPAIVVGINIYPDNPLKFDFIVNNGDHPLEEKLFNDESLKLIKYFLASLTIPEDEMWVNLSPYEKNRIIPDAFGQTEMGRDLLAQDYLLKQLSSSLMNPKAELGNKFWERVYSKAQEKFGTTEIPVNTFNKVWIVPKKATLYEHQQGALIVKSRLKVMLEEDYLALEANKDSTKHGLGDIKQDSIEIINGISGKVVREVLIPEIEREVNEGKTFANLRQVYHSMLLASWYKKAFKGKFLNRAYINQRKIKGVEVADKKANQKIYDQYVTAFKEGVFNLIREDYDAQTQQIIPRKYFSGGVKLNGKYNSADGSDTLSDFAILSDTLKEKVNVTFQLNPIGKAQPLSITDQSMQTASQEDTIVRIHPELRPQQNTVSPEAIADFEKNITFLLNPDSYRADNSQDEKDQNESSRKERAVIKFAHKIISWRSKHLDKLFPVSLEIESLNGNVETFPVFYLETDFQFPLRYKKLTYEELENNPKSFRFQQKLLAIEFRNNDPTLLRNKSNSANAIADTILSTLFIGMLEILDAPEQELLTLLELWESLVKSHSPYRLIPTLMADEDGRVDTKHYTDFLLIYDAEKSDTSLFINYLRPPRKITMKVAGRTMFSKDIDGNRVEKFQDLAMGTKKEGNALIKKNPGPSNEKKTPQAYSSIKHVITEQETSLDQIAAHYGLTADIIVMYYRMKTISYTLDQFYPEEGKGIDEISMEELDSLSLPDIKEGVTIEIPNREHFINLAKLVHEKQENLERDVSDEMMDYFAEHAFDDEKIIFKKVDQVNLFLFVQELLEYYAPILIESTFLLFEENFLNWLKENRIRKKELRTFLAVVKNGHFFDRERFPNVPKEKIDLIEDHFYEFFSIEHYPWMVRGNNKVFQEQREIFLQKMINFYEPESKGGIDLNLSIANIDVQKSSQGVGINIEDIPNLDNAMMSIEGFNAVIIKVTPMETLPFLQGFKNSI